MVGQTAFAEGKTRCDESGNVDSAIVDDWKQKLPSLLKGYDPKDIFNMDQTGLLF